MTLPMVAGLCVSEAEQKLVGHLLSLTQPNALSLGAVSIPAKKQQASKGN